ncbi:MAG: hypothetical protein ACK595_13785 [Planctomycetota bacterium]|jgi:hypothetical protein
MKTRLLLFVFLSGALSAQSAVDVPFHAAATECNESRALPFGYEAFRTQLLVDPAAISPNGAVLTGLRFRVDRYALPREWCRHRASTW